MQMLSNTFLGAIALTGVAVAVATTCLQTVPVRAAGPDAPAKGNFPWDWTGIIGTGQSLSIGARALTPISTKQPFNNMRLSTDDLKWPVDPDAAEIKLVPLTEPAGRKAPGFPSAWPTNVSGETPHTAMADAMTGLVKAEFNRDFVSIHSVVGEDGQGMKYLKKNPDKDPRGINGHAYEGSMVETKAIARLAKAAGKTYGVGAIVVTHGESDNGNANYDKLLHQLWTDYNEDIPKITGQTQKVLMIVSQQNAYNNSNSAIAMWRISDEYPDEMVCSGPKYQYPAFTDALHMTAEGYRLLGEKYAEVYYQRVILGKDWRPLEPTKTAVSGKTITVDFHVPVGPLVWDTEMDPPHAGSAEWKNGKGFEVGAGNQKITIDSVEIKGDSVVITCATDLPANTQVRYAQTGDGPKRAKPNAGFGRWGLLRDSDPFKGNDSGKVQPNYCLAFDMPAQ